MTTEFPCDVFLSHSAKDKAVVRPLAERLRADGLKVWFDEWECPSLAGAGVDGLMNPSEPHRLSPEECH
ncbi:MAG: toll/interleukin-1 receptor domain-containing protein [Verrucomicrobia bacterium]|nr:toll/interleukin-1 receptor domain-containing protein [Verrucomicrobiota bacterium]